MKCRYFLYIAELTILDCSATGCNRVRWNLTQSWGRKSHIHWHTCQLTEIDRSVTVCLTVTLYFSQTVCLCFCWLKKRVQVLGPAQTKNKKQQSSLQNKLFLGNVQGPGVICYVGSQLQQLYISALPCISHLFVVSLVGHPFSIYVCNFWPFLTPPLPWCAIWCHCYYKLAFTMEEVSLL